MKDLYEGIERIENGTAEMVGSFEISETEARNK